MRLYIIRHGETPWNSELRLQGQTDIELNEKGRALAVQTSAALADVPFDLVITSPLVRAEETAKLVLGGRTLPTVKEPRIAEISFGVMEGKQVRDAAGRVTDPVFYRFFHAPEQYVPLDGGESIDELCARTAEFLDELKNKKEWMDKTILVSTHGAASRALLSHIRHTDRSDFWGSGVPKNCAVSIVDLENGTWVIKEQDVVYYENV